MDPAVAMEVKAMSRHRAMNEAMERGDSDIQKFYKDAVIFVTGGSGFLGKHLIEKLFRSCDIKQVYLLLRGKKGKSAQERLDKIFQDPVYDGLHKSKPDFQKKVVAVEGNITDIKLGIAEDMWKKLSNEVTAIFHVAATTNFDEPLRAATLTNVQGTRETLALGKACKNIRSFVHVSTAFSHATQGRVRTAVYEKFYDAPLAPNTIIELVNTLSEEKLAALKPQLIEDWPNTYAFTKAIAEEAVRSMSDDLPICIVRPAIVISASSEPAPGWIDISSAYGPSGLVLGCGMGMMHTYKADDDITIDLIPADIVNNAIIAAGCETAKLRARDEKEVKIYTVAPSRNPIVWKNLTQILYKGAKQIATPKALWYNFDFHTKHHILFWILTWLLHYIPGYFIDGILRLLGKKPQALKMYAMAYKMSSVLSFYTCNQWKFDDANLEKMYKNLSITDKDLYNFDISKLSWEEILIVWAIGLRKYILKDGLKDTDYAVKKQYFFMVLNYFVLPLYGYALYKVLYLFIWLSFCLISFIY